MGSKRAPAFWLRLENGCNALFGQALNPLYHLGDLAFFFFWVVVVSGVYVYAFFKTGVAEGYDSLEYLSREQWYLGGIMRSVHRYAADSMAVVMVLHLLREFLVGRYRGFRWYSWITGVPLLWLVYTSGINGYWQVWDRQAQFVAIATVEWFDWLPIFSEPLARNFLEQSSLTDRFFSLLAFSHIGIPLILLLCMWIHIQRITRARTNPPFRLGLGIVLSLLVLSLVKPAMSMPRADLSFVPTPISLDWIYMAVYPLIYAWSPGAVWGLVGGATILLFFLPWLGKFKRPPVAEVHLDNCNGCQLCFHDCPYEAIIIEPRTDGRHYRLQAVVRADLCASCGICVGACPSSSPFRTSNKLQGRSAGGSTELVSGIEMPQLPVEKLRHDIAQAVNGLGGETRMLVFGCDHALQVDGLPGVASISLPCIAMLPTAFVDYALREQGVDGVLLTGCHESACHYRFGTRWMERRLAGEREPRLRGRVPRERVKVFWGSPHDREKLLREIEAFRGELQALPSEQGVFTAEDAKAAEENHP